MLNTNVDEIMYTNGKVSGIRSGNEQAKAPLIICDPSYVQTIKKVKPIGKIIRVICIMDHQIPNTNDATSCQIILPQKQLGRQNGKIIYYFLTLCYRYLHFYGEFSSCCVC